MIKCNSILSSAFLLSQSQAQILVKKYGGRIASCFNGSTTHIIVQAGLPLQTITHFYCAYFSTGGKFQQVSNFAVIRSYSSCQMNVLTCEEYTYVHFYVDENGCCPRTVKYLQGVAAGKWIVGYNCELL